MTTHFTSKSEVNLTSDAVWEPGQGDQRHAQDLEESEKERPSMKEAFIRFLTLNVLKNSHGVD